jgi:hypothetical protein
MVTLEQWMKVINYRISDGSCWNGYSPNAYSLSAWNEIHGKGGWSFNIVFDTVTQKVFEVDVSDYTNNRAYRIINSEFKSLSDDYKKAWDDVDYIDLETDEDWMNKASSIVLGKNYDTRISIPLDLSEDKLLELFKAAHDCDMTFNQFVEQVLKEFIAKVKNDSKNLKSE